MGFRSRRGWRRNSSSGFARQVHLETKKRFQVSLSEATLLQRITTGLPESFWARYRLLVQKRDAENLEPAEQLELISLSDQTEELTLYRTEALLELAKRRNTTIDALQVQFGLQPVLLS
jgi:hypothetical protein